MKKKIFVGLFIIGLCVLLVGCKENKKEETKEDTKVGGWTLNKDTKAVAIPEEAEKAFKDAIKDYKDMTLDPMVLLATQVVSGKNYMFLCKGTKDNTTDYRVSIVYKDLNGVSKITKVSKFDVEKYVSKTIDAPTEQLDGGWQVYGNIDEYMIEKDAYDVFESATKKLTGVKYSPLALIAKQVVSGTNYAILSLGTLTTGEQSQTHVYLLTIYKDLQNNVNLTSIAYVDLAEFNK